MDKKQDSFFWPSYVDLMTSLFFIMLLLFAISFKSAAPLKKENTELKRINDSLATAITNIKGVVSTMDQIGSIFQSFDNQYLKYQPEYQRFAMTEQINFKNNGYAINSDTVLNYSNIIKYLDKTGELLYKKLIELDQIKKDKHWDVSFIVIITGMTSKDGSEDHNYKLSYNRSLSLLKYWKPKYNFEEKFKDLIDFQISGVGEYGIGRNVNDNLNRTFYIQIISKFPIKK